MITQDDQKWVLKELEEVGAIGYGHLLIIVKDSKVERVDVTFQKKRGLTEEPKRAT